MKTWTLIFCGIVIGLWVDYMTPKGFFSHLTLPGLESVESPTPTPVYTEYDTYSGVVPYRLSDDDYTDYGYDDWYETPFPYPLLVVDQDGDGYDRGSSYYPYPWPAALSPIVYNILFPNGYFGRSR